MTIQHKALTDTDRHENKGVSTAAINTVATSSGAGSTVWKILDATNMGIPATTGGLVTVSGTGTFGVTSYQRACGAMYVSPQAEVTFNMTAGTSYKLVQLLPGLVGGNLINVSFENGSLVPNINGTYIVGITGFLTQAPSASAMLTFSMAGTPLSLGAYYSDGSFSATGLLYLNEGQITSPVVTASVSGQYGVNGLYFYIGMIA